MVCATTTPVDFSIFETLLQAVRRRIEAEYHTPDGPHFSLCFATLPLHHGGPVILLNQTRSLHYFPPPILRFVFSFSFFSLSFSLSTSLLLPGLNADHSTINLDR